MPAIRSLVPPGGFSNLVGHHVAALDLGLAWVRSAAREAASSGAAAAAVALLGELGHEEGAWVHAAVGGVPTPPPPEGEDVEAWIGWLDAVRTVSVMVLRPLQDRELERLVRVPGEDEGEGPRTLKRLLAELLFRQGSRHGRLVALAG
jgi:hypothetical protein